MEYNTHVKLICLLALFCSIKCSTTSTTPKPGVCRHKDGVKHCCAMYHLVNGDCVVCPNGTYRYNNDEMCTKCSSDMYGQFCAYKCDCKHNQICDPAEGCKCVDCAKVNITTEKQSEKMSAKSEQEIVTAQKQPEDMSIKSEQVDPVFNYWIIVGVPCGVIVIATSVIVSMQIRLLTSTRIGNIEIPLNDRVNYTNDAGSCYDYIDENMMINMPIPAVGNTTSTILKTDSNNRGLMTTVNAEEDESFINLYTSLAEDWQNETYGYNDGDNRTEEGQRHTHVNNRTDNIMINLTEENNETESLEKDIKIVKPINA